MAGLEESISWALQWYWYLGSLHWIIPWHIHHFSPPPPLHIPGRSCCCCTHNLLYTSFLFYFYNNQQQTETLVNFHIFKQYHDQGNLSTQVLLSHYLDWQSLSEMTKWAHIGKRLDMCRGGGKSWIHSLYAQETYPLPNLQIQTECLHTLTQSTACVWTIQLTLALSYFYYHYF